MARPRGPHKSTCGCISCASRTRSQKAIADGARRAREEREALGLPEPLVNVHTRRPGDPPIDHVVAMEGSFPTNEVVEVVGATQRDRVAQWIAWRALEPNLTMAEASARMGLSPSSLKGYIARAVQAGWLKFTDPIDRIEHEIIPKTIDNIAGFLAERDRMVTLETAKGTIFKHYQEAKGLLTPHTTVLALKIELPDAQTASMKARAITGTIVGTGRVAPTTENVVEAEVLMSEET